MYSFQCETTFDAEPAAVWKVWTDVSRWPEWDLTKEIARIDGPFVLGASGWAKQRGNLGGTFTITAYSAQRDASNPLALPVAPGANPLNGASFFVPGPAKGSAAGAIAQLWVRIPRAFRSTSRGRSSSSS